MNISYDTQGSATFMVYSLDPAEQIDNIGLGMITNNKMKGVIPIAFTQFDNVRQLRFNVSSMISLRNFLDVRVTKARALNVFSCICDAFIAADDFLLDRDMFMMDPNYIYTYVSTGETKLVYLPIVRETGTTDLCRFFKELMFTMQTDPSENTEYVARIINFLNKPESFNIDSFRALIHSLKQEGVFPSASEPEMQKGMPGQPMPAYTQNKQEPKPLYQNPVQYPSAGDPSQLGGHDLQNNYGMNSQQPAPSMGNGGYQNPVNQFAPNNGYPNPQHQYMAEDGTNAARQAPQNQNPGFEIPGGGTMKQSSAPASQKKVLFTFMGRPVGGGLTKEEKQQWMEEEKRKKEEEKKNKKGLFGKKGQAKQKEEQAPSFEIPGRNAGNSYPQQNSQPQQYSQPQPQYSQPQYSQPQQQYSQPQYSQPQYSQPQQYGQPQSNFAGGYTGNTNGGTVVLNNVSISEGTTVLNPSMNNLGKAAPVLQPYIVRCKTNEEIRIAKDVFRIGKERSFVDYFIMDNPTVSRSHADIVRHNNEYFIKDNNSLNHTFIEGNQLEPNKEYPLKTGMHFVLSNEEFEFKLR